MRATLSRARDAKVSIDVLAHFDAQVRQKKYVLPSAYRAEFCAGDVKRVIGPFAAAAHNWIAHHKFDPADADGIVEEQVAAFEAIGHAFRWKIYDHDAPEELPARLLARGFDRTDTSALMIVESQACGDAGPAGVAYEALSDPSILAAELKPVADEVWDDEADEFIEALAMELRDSGEHTALFAAKEHGATVGFGMTRYDRDFSFGGLFAGSTVPSARGRGIYRGMVAARAQHALARGAEHLYVEAGPMSRPILERVGFKTVSTVSNYVYRP